MGSGNEQSQSQRAWSAGVVPAALVNEAGIVVRDGEITPLSSRTPVVEHGATRVRPVTSDVAEQWLASVWVRDPDGRRRLVQARGRGAARPSRRWSSDWQAGALWAFVGLSRT